MLLLFWQQQVAKLCPTPCDTMNYSTPGFPALHYLPELAQTHVHRVSDVIQPSHPLSPLSLLPSNFPYYSECYTLHICLLSYIQENIYIIKVSQYLDSKGYTENLGQAPPQVIMFMNIFVYHQQSECLWDQQSIYFFLESQIKLYLYIWWVTII